MLLLMGWLNGGGAERVAVELYNRLHGRMLDMRMALLRRAGAYIDLVRPERLHFRRWAERWFPSDGANSSFYRPDRFLRSVTVGPLAFRSMIREADPDLVVSFTKGPNVLAYLALRGMGEKRPLWIAREGNNIVRSSQEDAGARVGRVLETALVRRAYRAADCVVANSARLADRLAEALGLSRERLRVVRNPVDVETIRAR
ncbi:MAG: glycosyltransferase, partial [Porphyrobacter sp.]|nr:glycosyltransferase [Porphyrobacter sp.]